MLWRYDNAFLLTIQSGVDFGIAQVHKGALRGSRFGSDESERNGEHVGL